jgi:hypothetical protein
MHELLAIKTNNNTLMLSKRKTNSMKKTFGYAAAKVLSMWRQVFENGFRRGNRNVRQN